MAEEDQSNTKSRRIRKVESVREKAEKTTLTEAQVKKPGIIRKVFRVIFWPFRMIAKPFKWLGRFKVFRFIGYIFVPPYFRNSWRELKLVTWPTKRESRRLTLAVMIFAIVFGVLVAIVDYGLDKIFKRILLKQ